MVLFKQEMIMPRLSHLLAAALIFSSSAILASPAARAADDPVKTVQSIYEAYVAAEKGGTAAPDGLEKARYTDRIGALLDAMNKTCVSGDQCGPDYDYLVDGQDFKIRKLSVKLLSREGDKASVEAKFSNLGTAVDKVYSMVRQGDDWKIDEIETKGGDSAKTLTSLLIATTEEQKK
jgi:hypothetical protein